MLLVIGIKVSRLRARVRRNQRLVFFHEAVYRLYLCRESLILFVRRCLIRLNLLSRECKLIAKYGRAGG